MKSSTSIIITILSFLFVSLIFAHAPKACEYDENGVETQASFISKCEKSFIGRVTTMSSVSETPVDENPVSTCNEYIFESTENALTVGQNLGIDYVVDASIRQMEQENLAYENRQKGEY